MLSYESVKIRDGDKVFYVVDVFDGETLVDYVEIQEDFVEDVIRELQELRKKPVDNIDPLALVW
jgi:hypothetical protein